MSKTTPLYGIYNGMTKRFVFEIAETSEIKARRKFKRLAPRASYCWRYSVKQIPQNWVNPKNLNYIKKAAIGSANPNGRKEK